MLKVEIGKCYIYTNFLYPGLKYRVKVLQLIEEKFANVKIVNILGEHPKMSASIGDTLWLRVKFLNKNT